MLREKFGFLQYSFQMYDVEEIAIVVYCSFILHNMAVEEQVHACEDAMESADFYNCIEEDDVIEDDLHLG
jgi:hypothetical protein